MFDPQVQYAHSVFDLIIPRMEEDFHPDFYTAYHKVIPKEPRWEDYMLVYELFYHLVMLYHVDDEKLQASLHPTADKVKDMLCNKYDAMW